MKIYNGEVLDVNNKVRNTKNAWPLPSIKTLNLYDLAESCDRLFLALTKQLRSDT